MNLRMIGIISIGTLQAESKINKFVLLHARNYIFPIELIIVIHESEVQNVSTDCFINFKSIVCIEEKVLIEVVKGSICVVRVSIGPSVFSDIVCKLFNFFFYKVVDKNFISVAKLVLNSL